MSDVFTSINDYDYQKDIWQPRINLALSASPLFTSGLLTRDPVLDALAAGVGLTFPVPFDNPLAAQDQMMGEGEVVQSYGLTGDSTVGIRTLRWTAFGYNDHAPALGGVDPLGKIQADAGNWTINANADIVFAILAGLFATGGALANAAHLQNIAAESTANQSASTRFNAANFLIAKQSAAGQAAGSFSIILCNSYIFLQMQLSNLVQNVTTVAVGDSVVQFGTWLGHTVVVMDALTSRAGTTSGRVYRTFVVAPGVLKYGDGLPASFRATEAIRTGDANRNKVIYRRSLIVAPTGCSWNGPVADATSGPTNLEYATANKWTRTFADSAIKILAFDTN